MILSCSLRNPSGSHVSPVRGDGNKYGFAGCFSCSSTRSFTVVHVRIIAKFALQITDDVFIFFFKHLRIFAVASRIIVTVIAAVFGNLVNEKQAQNLDPARIQFPLPLDMGTDRLTNLDTPLERYQLLIAADLTGVDFQAVQERDGIIAAVNAVWQDPITVSIFSQPLRKFIQAVTARNFPYYRPRSRCAFDLEAEACRRRFIRLLALPRVGKDEYKEKDLTARQPKIFNMFSGEECLVKLRCINRLADVMLDRFGREIILTPDDEAHFLVNVPVELSPPFYAWIVSFGRQVKILSPEKVVNGMRDFLQKSMDMYKNDGKM